jgi:hypothetical protein
LRTAPDTAGRPADGTEIRISGGENVILEELPRAGTGTVLRSELQSRVRS